MRIGTDAVLLGAWTNAEQAQKILDIGTGTGVIALMLAQRSEAEITGIEIEKNASLEAAENAQNSPWAKRVKIVHSSFQDFVKNTSENFDLIVSNPPFYINDMRPKNNNLAVARHSDRLPLYDLAKGAEKLLTANGKLALVLPVFSAQKFIRLAENYNLHLAALAEIKPNEKKETHRFLMEFSKTKKQLKREIIAIRTATNDNFTEKYKNLTRDFYLNF